MGICLLTVSPALARIEMNTVTGLWLFDEGSGNLAADSSDSALDATLEGNPAWVNGVFGSALELDGVDAYVEIPAHVNPTDAITVSLWVKSMDRELESARLDGRKAECVYHPSECGY